MMYNNWASDKQVTQYLRWNAHHSWGETAETPNDGEKHYDDPAFYPVGHHRPARTALFGPVSLFPAPALKTGLAPEYGAAWPCGGRLRTRPQMAGIKAMRLIALCTVRDYWFDTVGADWLAAVHANENIASSAVLQKVALCLRP